MVQVYVISFGYGHAPAPEADLTLDTRRLLRNPHHDPRMRELTGLDEVVRQHVLATPGAARLISTASVLVADLHVQTNAPVTVAVGCVGGRHRSVVIAEELAATLRSDGIKTSITHRDVHRDVIQRQPQLEETNMAKKVGFAVYKTNKNAQYTMAYTCDCGQPVIGYSDDSHGMFVGTCGNGHTTTVLAS